MKIQLESWRLKLGYKLHHLFNFYVKSAIGQLNVPYISDKVMVAGKNVLVDSWRLCF